MNIIGIEDNNHPVFKFLNPNGNDRLSMLKDYDLKEFLDLLDDYYLTLRKDLGLDRYITFGMEIEFSRAMSERIEKRLQEVFADGKWKLKVETAFPDGREIATPPLRDDLVSWNALDTACKIVKEYGYNNVKYNNHVHSGHIHIGANILGEDPNAWLNFLKFWGVYENVIFRFGYGEFLTERASLREYAAPIDFRFLMQYDKLKNERIRVRNIVFDIATSKDYCVNFENVDTPIPSEFDFGNTIEFRCPNGTLNTVVWQNNLNFLAKMLLYAKSGTFDNDTIDKRRELKKQGDFSSILTYRQIYLEQALELCDLVFDNNLDKVYFLRQYLKSFEIGHFPMQDAKPFTRERTK